MMTIGNEQISEQSKAQRQISNENETLTVFCKGEAKGDFRKSARNMSSITDSQNFVTGSQNTQKLRGHSLI